MCRLRRKDGTGFETQEEREIDHGEENKGEEKIRAQGCPEAPFGAEARGSVNAGGRTGADALVEPAERFWRRRRR